jgi:hypothetical protein
MHTYKLHILVLDRVDNSRERLNRATQHSKTLNQIGQNVLPNKSIIISRDKISIQCQLEKQTNKINTY